MKPLHLALIALAGILVLAAVGVGIAWAVRAGAEAAQAEPDGEERKAIFLERVREHARQAWAAAYPDRESRALQREPLIRPEGDEVFVRFAWGRVHEGRQELERIELHVSEQGELLREPTVLYRERQAAGGKEAEIPDEYF